MKKYFLYELKKHLWTLVILTAACALPYIVHTATLQMYYEIEWKGAVTERYIESCGLENVFIMLLVLLFVVPILVYSFKMSKRGVDGYYSLPLKKEKLYFVLTMVGLILVLVPYTVSFWGGFLTLLCRKGNPYNMSYYVPAYFAGLCFGVFLYGVNAFVFTRANRISDGAIYMAAYAFVGLLFINFVEQLLPHGRYISTNISLSFVFGGGMFEYADRMDDLIRGHNVSLAYAGWWFSMPIAAGAVCYALFFYLLRYEKGEDAEQNSESPFGYRALIPAYLALSVGGGAMEAIGGIFLLVAGSIATMIYKRTFRLKWQDFLPLAIGFTVGIVLMLLGA